MVQAVVLGGHFLALVEHQRQVAGQLRGVRQSGEGVRVAGGARLHVHGAEAEDGLLPRLRVRPQARGQVIRRRHGIQVARQNHPIPKAAMGARDQGVSPARDLYVLDVTQGGLDSVGDLLLVVRLAVDVNELAGKRDRPGDQVDGRR